MNIRPLKPMNQNQSQRNQVHNLIIECGERIAAGLVRRGITTCSRWAEQYRIMGQPLPGPFGFKYHPWCREMHDYTGDMVGQKGAQLGFTETALNKVFFAIDVKGISVLYILPASAPDASDFSTSRFDPALESSPHLRSLFSDVKNIGHKRAGHANLFIRGSRSRSQLKSIPVGLIIADEVDEMVQENLPLAFERMSGQMETQKFLLSTPTLDGFGINAHYRNSTQEEFFFRCPACSRLTRLIFPECLVITADDPNDPAIEGTHIICKECKAILPNKGKVDWLKNSEWVPAKKQMPLRGFQVSQLYSMVEAVAPPKLAQSYLKSLTNADDEQEFFNSKLGLTHMVKGARLTDEDIIACIGDYIMADRGKGFVTMGVDIGTYLHYEIDQWQIPQDYQTPDINLLARPRVLRVGKLDDFHQIHHLMKRFSIRFCVIDAQPERRKAFEVAEVYGGRVKLCFYGRGIQGKTINVHTETEQTITVDRTSWLDLALGRFLRQHISLPRDIPLDYREHLKALIRVYKKDKDGNPIGRYVKTENDLDHYAHARNYAEIALPLGLSLGKSQNIRSAP